MGAYEGCGMAREGCCSAVDVVRTGQDVLQGDACGVVGCLGWAGDGYVDRRALDGDNGGAEALLPAAEHGVRGSAWRIGRPAHDRWDVAAVGGGHEGAEVIFHKAMVTSFQLLDDELRGVIRVAGVAGDSGGGQARPSVIGCPGILLSGNDALGKLV